MNPDPPLPSEATALVQAELRAGERIVWLGQPLAGRYARKGIVTMLFAIPFTAFAVFWIAGATAGTMHMPTRGNGGSGLFQWFRLFPLFGLPFLLVGLGMFGSPYWMWRKARRMVYAVTNQRAMIFDPGFWRGTTIRSFGPERLQELRRVQRGDGSGDVIFGRELSAMNNNGRQVTDVGFLAVADAKRTEDLLLDLVSKARPPA